MCMSPHEMTSARIEKIIEDSRRMIEEGLLDSYISSIYEERIEEFEKLLKERAEDGTYATAGI